MDSNGKCHFLRSGDCNNFFNCCPFFPYPSASTKNTALEVGSDQILCKGKQKSRTGFLFWGAWQSMAGPAHLGKSKWLFSTGFILLLLRVRMAGRGQPGNVCVPGCASSWGAAEHCRSFLVSGHDFSLPSYPLIFLFLLL